MAEGISEVAYTTLPCTTGLQVWEQGQVLHSFNSRGNVFPSKFITKQLVNVWLQLHNTACVFHSHTKRWFWVVRDTMSETTVKCSHVEFNTGRISHCCCHFKPICSNKTFQRHFDIVRRAQMLLIPTVADHIQVPFRPLLFLQLPKNKLKKSLFQLKFHEPMFGIWINTHADGVYPLLYFLNNIRWKQPSSWALTEKHPVHAVSFLSSMESSYLQKCVQWNIFPVSSTHTEIQLQKGLCDDTIHQE